MFTEDGRNIKDVTERCAQGLQVLGRLKNIWNARNTSMTVKCKMYNTLVLPVILYGAETWTLRRTEENKLLTTEMTCLRRIRGISRRDKIRNNSIREMVGIKKNILETLEERRLRWYGHVRRMQRERIPQKAMTTYVEGKRTKGRQRKRWIQGVDEALEKRGTTLKGIHQGVYDRELWKAKCRMSWTQRP